MEKKIGAASWRAIESRFGISAKNYPRNLFLVQKKVSSIFRPRVQKWVIFGRQKWGGSGIIVQKWGGASKNKTKQNKTKQNKTKQNKTKQNKKKKLVGYAALLGVFFFFWGGVRFCVFGVNK